MAFVPLHPYDVKGRPPINRKEEVFEVKNKNGISVERVKFEPGHPIKSSNRPRESIAVTICLRYPGQVSRIWKLTR